MFWFKVITFGLGLAIVWWASGTYLSIKTRWFDLSIGQKPKAEKDESLK